MPPHHDPNMYYGAAAAPPYGGAYPIYGTHQQQVSWKDKIGNKAEQWLVSLEIDPHI